MGTSSLIDIIGSFVVGGLIFLMALRLNQSSMERYTAYYSSFNLQTNLTALVSIIEDDFSRVGYSSNANNVILREAIVFADTERISFRTDIVDEHGRSDGKMDTITYYIGPTSELLSTPNPRDRYLYRQINTGLPIRIYLGLTEFRFKYFNATEREIRQFPVPNPGGIHIIQLSVSLENPVPHQDFMDDTTHYKVYWRQMRLVSKMMQNS